MTERGVAVILSTASFNNAEIAARAAELLRDALLRDGCAPQSIHLAEPQFRLPDSDVPYSHYLLGATGMKGDIMSNGIEPLLQELREALETAHKVTGLILAMEHDNDDPHSGPNELQRKLLERDAFELHHTLQAGGNVATVEAAQERRVGNHARKP